jgi:hypothetical protein
MESFLVARGVEDEVLGKLMDVLRICDTAQYSPLTVGDRVENGPRETIDRASEIIRALEKRYLS